MTSINRGTPNIHIDIQERDRIHTRAPSQTNPLTRHIRKQTHPRRSLKQLASLADKILQGIIVIEPDLPWETDASQYTRERRAFFQGTNASLPSSNSNATSSEDDEGQSSTKKAKRSSAANKNATVSRSPSSMGIHISEDKETAGIEERRQWYEAVLAKRRSATVKGITPLDISQAPGSSLMTKQDFSIASRLRLSPAQFFHSRDTLVGNFWSRGFYKKSAAQKMLHIDVNKTGKLYDYFVEQRLMPATERETERLLAMPAVDWKRILE